MKKKTATHKKEVSDQESDSDSSVSSGEFEVEKILAKKVKNGKTYYLVKWKGYKDTENTWEPEKGVGHLTKLIKKFEESNTVPSDSNEASASHLQKNSRKIKKGIAIRKVYNDADKRTARSAIKRSTPGSRKRADSEEGDKKYSKVESLKKAREARLTKIKARKLMYTSRDAATKETKGKNKAMKGLEYQEYGSFDNGDEPNQILAHTIIHTQLPAKTDSSVKEKYLFLKVAWKPRKNGPILDTWEKVATLKEHCPKLIEEYYSKYVNLD